MLEDYQVTIRSANLGGLLPDAFRWQGEISRGDKSLKFHVYAKESSWRACAPSPAQVLKAIANTASLSLWASSFAEWREELGPDDGWWLTPEVCAELEEQGDRLGRLTGDLTETLEWIDAVGSLLTYKWDNVVAIIEK